MASSGTLLVAAIDFGTTYSGYAFSTKHDYNRDPTTVSSHTWSGGQLMSLKTPTCILFTPDRTFDCFGFEAEDKYMDLSMEGENHEWYLFRRFKMQLYHNKNLSRNFEIQDTTGKRMKVLTVISACIKFLKEHLMELCTKQCSGILSLDITWVVTIPAIWSDASKQIMRLSAEQAGIPSKQLRLCLEPEAASLYCRHIPLQKRDSGDLQTFSKGTKYIVLDAGGGTIDITVHEVQQDGTLKEIDMANGGDWGGTKVDEAFSHFFEDALSREAYKTFCKESSGDEIDMLRDFEVKKRTVKWNETKKITMKVPSALNEACKSVLGGDIKAHISRGKLKEQVSVVSDKCRVAPEIIQGFFNEPVKRIVDQLKNIAQHSQVRGVSTILMVGGFSESDVLQHRVREAFPNLKVIVPNEAGLAVLKGAVIYGHEPEMITTRVCRYTYGVDTSSQFVPGKHDEEKKEIRTDGRVRCRDIFSRHVKIGQSVAVGEPQTSKRYHPTEPHKTKVGFDIFASNQDDPMYVTDPGCIKIGKIDVPMPDTSKGLDRTAEVYMTFSSTELEVTAKNTDTGEVVDVSCDFL